MAEPLEEVERQSSKSNNGDGSSPDASQKDEAVKGEAAPEGKKKQSVGDKVKALWAKTGLDVMTMKIMFKGALAPTIAISMYQATAVADFETTLGYLAGIVSILSFAIMPRAKFLQSMFYMVLTTCAATAFALLAIYTCVQARLHTTPVNRAGTGGSSTSGTPSPGASTAPYNSSACVVAGIWLFFQVWIINTMRARNPALTPPGIVACIFANVSMVYAPQFSTMAQGMSFAKRLFETFLIGFGIGTGVSLFVFPVTMRQVVFKEMTGYVMTLRKLLKANMTYIESLQSSDMFSRTPTGNTGKPRAAPAQAIKDILAGLAALQGKLSIDIKIAKREVAIGCLGPDDLQEIFRRLRLLLLPMIGLSSVNDVFERITEEWGWSESDYTDGQTLEGVTDDMEKIRLESRSDWNSLAGILQEPFGKVVGYIDQGFAHILFTLKLVPLPKSEPASEDVEAEANAIPKPGSKEFTVYLGQEIGKFHKSKIRLLKHYCELRGIKVAPDFFDKPRSAGFEAPAWYHESDQHSEKRFRYRRQLYLVLYMDFLLDSIAHAVLDFCKWADEREACGKLSRQRLVVPGYKRFRKYIITSLSSKQDSYQDEQEGMNSGGGESVAVYLGDAYHKRRDPEHLPPANAFERLGNRFRGIPHFLRSPASAFGLRVAIATMCLAVVAYLHDTQRFYVTQRLFWAQIMVTISCSPSAGQSLFSFCLRIFGTFCAMCASLLLWYIVDGQTPGVLVLFFFTVIWGFYIVLKQPRIVPVGMIFSVTNTLIIGYELQVRKVGVAVSTSNGQAYLPIYELAPYRLATVCAGIFVAWVWTVIPWPISEHSELRKDLGASLYLMANYYSVVQETVRIRIEGQSVYVGQEDPVKKLDKARIQVFSKSMLVLQGLRTHSQFLKFDIPIGGKFPQKTYNKIIGRIQDILNFTSLISYASQTFTDMHKEANDNESESEWLRDFRSLMHESNISSHEVTTLLALLSASVASGQPLPPYLKAPASYQLTARLDAMDKDILSLRHIVEPGYAAFACMQIGVRCVTDDLKALLRDVKELVGELDFSFHTISTADSSPSDSSETLEAKNGKGKAD